MISINARFIPLAANFTAAITHQLQENNGLQPGFNASRLPEALKQEFNHFCQRLQFTETQAAVLLLCAACDLQGQAAGNLLPEQGDYKLGSYTISELQFLLGGTDEKLRETVLLCMLPSSKLIAEGYLRLVLTDSAAVFIQSHVTLHYKGIEKCIAMENYKPAFGPEFPARRITAQQDWDSLVLSATTMQGLEDILVWLQQRHTIAADARMARAIKPGYRALFYGPPGTGKTFTAALLGKKAGLPVYCIDLSLVVSKYIGETEKNLEMVFSTLENEDCILFFDEADALFGKRTNVSNSNDRYANQEVSYLLQRLEDFKGLTILASNYKGNIDQAFTRRFNSMINFALPGKEERLRIWQLCEPRNIKYSAQVNLNMLADRFELSGSTILNSVYYAFLHCQAAAKTEMDTADILEGIRNEYTKMEKTMPAWLQSERN